MLKKAGIAIMAVGAVLILSALLLFAYNRYEDAKAGQEAESLLADVEAAIETRETEDSDTQTEEAEEPVVMLEGYEYIGYMEIPALELKLPVMADWDYKRLKIAPCRQFGSTLTDDLVIAAHNYEKHFGRLKDLSQGDVVYFTDMDGTLNSYAIEKIETLNPTAVDEVQNSGYDLVLYTCTKGGKTRVTVFCNRTAGTTGAE